MLIPTTISNQIDDIFKEYDQPTSPGCALGVILDGDLVYARGYGMADLETKQPITPDTVFHLASVSKQFTATAIALLGEAGELLLEQDVRFYIPYLPDFGQALTLRHLVQMTNGLEDFYEVSSFIKGKPEHRALPEQEAIRIIRAADWLKFRPGEQWSYGNTGYFLLARIVEKVAGYSFAGFAAEHIFKPLGMRSTFIRTDPEMIIPDRAQFYAPYSFVHYKDGPAVPQAAPVWCRQEDQVALSGAGGVWSTVNDLFLWDQNFYHNVLGKGAPGLIGKMTSPGKLNDGTPTHYGYGQVLTSWNGLKVVFHEGGSTGINTVIYRLPQKCLSVILLSNTSNFLTVMLRKLGEESYERIAGMVLPWPPVEAAHPAPAPARVVAPASPVSRLELERAVGSYQDPVSSYIWEVSLSGSRLEVLENYAARFALIPDGPAFQAEGRTLRCTFRTGMGPTSGLYTQLLVESAGGRQVFQRYLSLPLERLILAEYAGSFVNPRLQAGYRVRPVAAGLQLENLDPACDMLDVVFTPTVRDMFIARYPPAIGWYVMQFRRDASGSIVAFVFRDEVPGRDNWVFEKEH